MSYKVRLACGQCTAHDSMLAQLDHFLPARTECAENCKIAFVGCEVALPETFLERGKKKKNQTKTTHQYEWQTNVRLQQF